MDQQPQYQQETSQQLNQQPKPPLQGMRSGQMFPLDPSQQLVAHLPPTVPPQQQQEQAQQQLRMTIVDGVQVPDQTNFDRHLKQWLLKQGVTLEPQMLIVDTKEINLYELFMEVLKEGGGSAVTGHNLWPVIGGILGFVQFPANGTEPAKAGPQVATHLMNVHKTYLSTWENVYIQRIMQRRGRQAVASAAHGGLPQSINQITQAPGQHPDAQRPPQQGRQPPPHGFRPELPPSAYTRFAHMSVEEMRKQGIPEHYISLIEAHRPQQQWEQQQQHEVAESAQPAGAATVGRPQQGMPAGMPGGPQQLVPQSQQIPAQGQNNFYIPSDMARPPPGAQGGASIPAAHVSPLPLQDAAPLPTGQFTRPTLTRLNVAMAFIHMAEAEHLNKKRTFQPVQVAEHEKGLYMQQFDQLWRVVQEVEQKLVMYHALFGDEQSTTKLVAIISATKEQRKMFVMPAAPPQYILSSQLVRELLAELHNVMDRFYKAIATMAPTPPTAPQQTQQQLRAATNIQSAGAETTNMLHAVENDTTWSSTLQPFSKNSDLCLDGKIIQRSEYSVVSGGFADIWTGILERQTVAIKTMRSFSSVGALIEKDRLLKRLWREYVTWSCLRHPNILDCLGFSYDFTSSEREIPSLISPWMPNGTVSEYIQRYPTIDRLNLIGGIANGLTYLHDREPAIIHGDIRAGNILVSDKGIPCLADFGLSRILGGTRGMTTSSDAAGSMRWMSPELFDGEKVTESSDVWAFGMTLLEILTGKRPYHEFKLDAMVLRSIIDGRAPLRPTMPDPCSHSVTDQIWEICRRCWLFEASGRPSMGEITRELFLGKYPLEFSGSAHGIQF